jgi:hypothetical protein
MNDPKDNQGQNQGNQQDPNKKNPINQDEQKRREEEEKRRKEQQQPARTHSGGSGS